ncbi:MAG: hypothetical protein ACO3D0_14560, partial [Ilumatobacteraceae bacterium]
AYTAKCFDCHGSHDIQRVSNPASRVHPGNRLETCRKCHEGATAGFVTFERFHQQRVVAVLSVFAVVEVVSAGALALVETGVSSWLWLSGGVVLVVLWVSTGAFYAPLHGRLSTGFDARLHRRLVMSNWVRTVLWSVRGVLAVSMLVAASS